MPGGTDNRLIVLDLGGGIRVKASGDPGSTVLSRFFSGYDRAFVLPDEREELEGFKACLALNRSHRHAYGRTHSELVAVFEDERGTLLGGANLLATGIDSGGGLPPATIALNYVYVEAAARGRGLLRVILGAVRELALVALGLDRASLPPAIFIEQNDPLRLTAEEYAADTAHSGTDQVDRLAIWAKVGARVVDFPYVQPALSALQQPDDGLIYAAIDYPHSAIDAGLLHDHLESFFGISVRKGVAEVPDGVAARQLAALGARAAPVPLLPMEPALDWLRSGRPTHDFDSFRALAKTSSAEE
ncbi:hypothetical protein [Sphingomonas colocasiae]|uniref:GNAT family N-acetyltransferase n=1 Tax=Sphingomonas colocasiae TaxID=1848973 RepID=A0ABS7PRW9_9SPHN|nr:hypothetical protein [Sphingomonas colocasiae]MBY8823425.1 hypothetical protein [Sphingomonas colocasiae]